MINVRFPSVPAIEAQVSSALAEGQLLPALRLTAELELSASGRTMSQRFTDKDPLYVGVTQTNSPRAVA